MKIKCSRIKFLCALLILNEIRNICNFSCKYLPGGYFLSLMNWVLRLMNYFITEKLNNNNTKYIVNIMLLKLNTFLLFLMTLFNPTGGGSFEAPPPNKNCNFSTFFGPIKPKKFDFSYKPMRMPPILFRGLKMVKKGVSIAFLLSALTKSRYWNLSF